MLARERWFGALCALRTFQTPASVSHRWSLIIATDGAWARRPMLY